MNKPEWLTERGNEYSAGTVNADRVQMHAETILATSKSEWTGKHFEIVCIYGLLLKM